MRRLLIFLIAWLCSSAIAQSQGTFVFVQVNESIQPLARAAKYEDPLDAALKQAKLGEVTGGGSMLTKEGRIEWVGIDVELANVDRGIPFLKAKLRDLGVPKGSTLEYRSDGKKFVVPVHDPQ